MGRQHNVKVEVDAKFKNAKIRVRGQLKDASVVIGSIRRFLHDMEMKEHEKEQAQLLCQYVSSPQMLRSFVLIVIMKNYLPSP